MDVGTTLRKSFLFVLLFGVFLQAFSQSDSVKVVNNFWGSVSVTTKGISTFPNLTLGKPAAIFDLAMGRKLTFEPQFRFDLHGKPWTFIFWWRYKVISSDNFRFNVGAHPAFTFRTQTFSINGIAADRHVVNRYLATELAPTFMVSKNVGIGLYHIYSHGIEKELIRHSNFISMRSSFSNIKLTNQFYLRFNPQVYYLRLDENGGFYFNSTLTLARRGFPLSISSQINKTIQSDLSIGEDFLWNVTLVYSFNKRFVETQQ